MIKKNAVVILGYNNTRINDVKKIKEKARHTLDAQTILCKLNPSFEDKQVVDYVIDVDLAANVKNVEMIIQEIEKMLLKIIAILPFSDPGTQLGALLGTHLKLPTFDPKFIDAALDKYIFRQYESQASEKPLDYYPIHAEKIFSLEQLKKLYQKYHGNLFVKPAKEGNSRGCINLKDEKDLEAVWFQLTRYLEGGLVAEELMFDVHEYSWDHVAGYSWITEKKTTQNQYRAEIQQIVPAPLSKEISEKIQLAGVFMGKISGYQGGACHNEIFYDPSQDRVMAVEPNLRPAGMRIWDLAQIAFEDFDPWAIWLSWASGKDCSSLPLLKQKYYAGIRMITASNTGVLENLPIVTGLSTEHVDIIEVIWTKKMGDLVAVDPKDNSDFIGYVIARSKSYEHLFYQLNRITTELSNKIEIK